MARWALEQAPTKLASRCFGSCISLSYLLVLCSSSLSAMVSSAIGPRILLLFQCTRKLTCPLRMAKSNPGAKAMAAERNSRRRAPTYVTSGHIQECLHAFSPCNVCLLLCTCQLCLYANYLAGRRPCLQAGRANAGSCRRSCLEHSQLHQLAHAPAHLHPLSQKASQSSILLRLAHPNRSRTTFRQAEFR